MGIKPPLFDRLIDDYPEETIDSGHQYLLTHTTLIESLQRELSYILNTRLTSHNKDYDELIQDPLNFGLPSLFGLQDFNSFDGSNTAQWGHIAQLCQQAIHHFEPRLSEVKVNVNRFNKTNQSLEIEISRMIKLEKLRASLLPMVLDCH